MPVPAGVPVAVPVAPPVAPAPAAKAPVAPPNAVDVAAKQQLPSVDIEVFFEFDSADITPPAVETLTPLGRALTDGRLAGGTFLIAGHTDGKGPAPYNLRLSQQRAEAVRQLLIDRFGIEPARLIARGYGSERLKNRKRPTADENRRVQIINWTSQVAR